MVYMLVSKSKLFSLSPYFIQKKYVYEKPVLAYLISWWENYYFHSRLSRSQRMIYCTVNALRLRNFAFRNKLLLHNTVFGHLQKASFGVLYHEDSKSLSCYCQIPDVLCKIWSAHSIWNLHFLSELLYQMTCCSTLNYAMDLSKRRSISLGVFSQVSTYRWLFWAQMDFWRKIKSTNTVFSRWMFSFSV